MPARSAIDPPRPIAPGDIVAGYSDPLGEWTAAQITHLNPSRRKAGVLDLRWSGPKPSALGDPGRLEPLRLTHHAHKGQLSHAYFNWVLPRSCAVMGRAPLLVDRPPNTNAPAWRMGDQLDRQRRWDLGDHTKGSPGRLELTGAEFHALARSPKGIWDLTIRDIDELQADRIVQLFPNLTGISLSGDLGTLTNAIALNELGGLRRIWINNLFGMTASDCPQPQQLSGLDALRLHSVPAGYAGAVRRAWTAEIAHGTDLEISSPRKADWVVENRDNPLRRWDGRSHISSTRYRKAVAQYRTSRAAVVDALGAGADADALTAIGREYGDAFNKLDSTAPAARSSRPTNGRISSTPWTRRSTLRRQGWDAASPGRAIISGSASNRSAFGNPGTQHTRPVAPSDLLAHQCS